MVTKDCVFILRKGHFILLSVIYGVSLGVLNNWSSVLNVNLDPFGIGEVGYIFVRKSYITYWFLLIKVENDIHKI